MDSQEPFLGYLKEQVESTSLQYVCDMLRKFNCKYNCGGIYLLKNKCLVLESFSGAKTEHEILPLGSELRSLAIEKNSIVNETNVKTNPEFISCFVSTESELVVPIRKDDKAIGEININSDIKNTFSKFDEQFVSIITDHTTSKKL